MQARGPNRIENVMDDREKSAAIKITVVISFLSEE